MAKTYRREKWGAMLQPLLTMWYDCGRQLGDVELTVRLLVEMLAPGMMLEPLTAVFALMFCGQGQRLERMNAQRSRKT